MILPQEAFGARLSHSSRLSHSPRLPPLPELLFVLNVAEMAAFKIDAHELCHFRRPKTLIGTQFHVDKATCYTYVTGVNVGTAKDTTPLIKWSTPKQRLEQYEFVCTAISQ